ncbi:hypothetical protein GCM10010371_33940 [Streptomyces subrutilus]|uniref:Uncharacterized protein n=1 Tax=Streptomyces subrutilus TaxID=36818 RepID=A0A918V6Y6_9ACTN|nr:hypothetical protein GCM10010371_33940 [Streptomyces subrutilus]
MREARALAGAGSRELGDGGLAAVRQGPPQRFVGCGAGAGRADWGVRRRIRSAPDFACVPPGGTRRAVAASSTASPLRRL